MSKSRRTTEISRAIRQAAIDGSFPEWPTHVVDMFANPWEVTYRSDYDTWRTFALFVAEALED